MVLPPLQNIIVHININFYITNDLLHLNKIGEKPIENLAVDHQKLNNYENLEKLIQISCKLLSNKSYIELYLSLQ